MTTNGNGTSALDVGALTAIESFRAARERALDAIRAEREKLMKRVAEIDALLAEVGDRGPHRRKRPGGPGRPASVPGTKRRAVEDFLRSNPGSTIGSILAATGASRPLIAALVHRKVLVSSGTHGTKSYFINGAEA